MRSLLGGTAALAMMVALPGETVAYTPNTERDAPVPAAIRDAPIALLVDLTSGQVLHSRNSTRRFVPASVAKTMTAYVAFELLREGKLKPGQRLSITDETFEEWNGKGSTMWLDTETPTTVDDLLTGILAVSANDAAIVLAEGAAGSVRNWTDLMNANARELEMTASHFGTPNGWPDEGKTFTTAEDLVKLARAVIRRHPERFERYFGNRTYTWNGIQQSNYDPLLGVVDGADGLKTGFTREAGFSYLGTAEQNGQRLVIVIAGTDSVAVRASLARQYIEWGFASFDREKLFEEGDNVGVARVQGGALRQVGLVTDRRVYVNVPKDRTSEMTAKILYDGPVRAPIKAGDRIGMLEIEVPGMEPARVPLLASEDVEQAGFFGRLENGLVGWIS